MIHLDGDTLVKLSQTQARRRQRLQQPKILRFLRPDQKPRAGEKTLRYTPYPSAQKFHDARADAKLFLGPVGSGKTLTLCAEAVRLSYGNPGLPGLLCSPTYSMSHDIVQPALFALLRESGVPYLWRRARREVEFTDNGSVILLRSMDREDSLRGTNIAWCAVDEGTICSEESYQLLSARVRHPKASECAIAIAATPKGRDYMWRMFLGPDKIPGFTCIQAPPKENLALLEKHPDYYEKLSRLYPDRLWRQECLGEICDSNTGRVYHSFDPTRHLDQSIAYMPMIDLAVAWDFNVEFGGAVIVQVVPQKVPAQMAGMYDIPDKILVIDEVVGAHTTNTCDLVWDKIQRWNPQRLVIYGDATGRGRESLTGNSNWGVVHEFFQKKGVQIDFRVDRTNPAIFNRLNSVNAALLSHSGEQRLWIHPRCKELIKDFTECVYNSSGKDVDQAKDRSRSHLSSALGYLVHKTVKIHEYKTDTTKPLPGAVFG